jgi:2-methylcitrate dehydratase PrpD
MTRDLSPIRYADAPHAVQERLAMCLLDLIGVGYGGAQTELAQIITRFAASQFGGTHSFMLASGTASPAGVALAGGMTIDALDGHDGHNLTKGHVGCGLLPGLIALAPEGCSGEDFLDALLLGYEVGTRLGQALHATAPDYHTSGAWIAPAVAIAGARLRHTPDDVARHAAGIAEYHGPRSQMMRNIAHPTMLKDGSGWGAMAGTSAAYLAAEGFTGAPAITITADNVASYWQDLGQHWQILNQYFKPYPVCRWAQPAVAACLSLRLQHHFDPRLVEQITLWTFHEGVRLFSNVPNNTEQAQYAISFPVAMAVLNGVISTDDVYSGFNDAKVKDMIGKVTLLESAKYNEVFPAQRWAHVCIRMVDGTEMVSDPHEALGDPHKPMSKVQFQDKYMNLCEPVWGRKKAQQVLAYIEHLESGNLADLMALVRS